MSFQANQKKHTEKSMFFDEEVDIQRFDVVKYPMIDRLNETQQGYFWRPQEVDVSQDRLDFMKLVDHEKHIFTSNIFRQILLDTKQGADPSEVLLPVASLPEVQNFITTWTFFEGGIHSRSYTHIIRNVYPDPSAVFDGVLKVPEILDCADEISKYYDDLKYKNTIFKLLGYGKHVINGDEVELTPYEHKKSMWKCLNSINILEGIRFYVSFACSWAFGENKQMEGNAKIIRFICRDENLHLAATQLILRLLKKEDPDFAKIADECHDEVQEMFLMAIQQEEEWADYLFQYGSMIGLNSAMVKDYVRWIGSKRMAAVGVKCPYSVQKSNPLPWTEKWITSTDIQEAPQETEKSSYVVGGIDSTLESKAFSGFSLD